MGILNGIIRGTVKIGVADWSVVKKKVTEIANRKVRERFGVEPGLTIQKISYSDGICHVSATVEGQATEQQIAELLNRFYYHEVNTVNGTENSNGTDKIWIESAFLRKIVQDILQKEIKKSMGCDCVLNIQKLHITHEDDLFHLDADLSADLSEADVETLLSRGKS